MGFSIAPSEPPNGVSKDDFYDPPLSEIGGWKRAEEQFSTLRPQEMVNEYRNHLCDIIGDIEENNIGAEETDKHDTRQETDSI